MNSGSPIDARLTLSVFPVIIIALILISFVTVLYFLSKRLSSYKNSKQYAEKNKDKKTTTKEINDVAKRAKLSKTGREILTTIFKEHPLPNIYFAIKEAEILESYLKETYKAISVTDNQQTISEFFKLRYNIYTNFDQSMIIKNSRLIPVETEFKFTPSQGVHHTLKVIESLGEEFHLLMPPVIQNEEKPEILSKINLIFTYKSSAAYNLETRIVRYQKGKNNSDIMVCTHSDKIFPLQKRTAPRLDLNTDCQFASAKPENESDSKEASLTFKTGTTMHQGILADTSAGGCRIFTKLPIKAKQYIYISGPLDGKENGTAIGQILRTTKNKNEEYILHIKFEKINEETVNKINASACGYNS